MTSWLASRLFAADVAAFGVGEVIYAVIIIIGFLSWLMQTITGQNKRAGAGGRPRQPPRPRDGRLQSEIDVFLQEVSGKKPQPDEVEIEIVPEPERRPRRVVKQKRPKRPQQARRSEKQREKPRSRPGSKIAQRKGPGSEHFGEEVSDHAEQLGGDVRSHVQQHMGDRVGESVETHLGSRRPAPEVVDLHLPGTSLALAQEMITLLRDPAGVRQAIILNEILSPPKGLRPRR